MDPDKPEKKRYMINDVATMVGLSQKRIREYEKEGLVKPSRQSRTNNRIYKDADIKQIRRVKQLLHKHGFTLSCLKYFMASAPCWNIFDCAEREACPAYNAPHSPCYDVMQANDASHLKKCQNCYIYLNRKMKSFSLFDKPQ